MCPEIDDVARRLRIASDVSYSCAFTQSYTSEPAIVHGITFLANDRSPVLNERCWIGSAVLEPSLITCKLFHANVVVVHSRIHQHRVHGFHHRWRTGDVINR